MLLYRYVQIDFNKVILQRSRLRYYIRTCYSGCTADSIRHKQRNAKQQSVQPPFNEPVLICIDCYQDAVLIRFDFTAGDVSV